MYQSWVRFCIWTFAAVGGATVPTEKDSHSTDYFFWYRQYPGKPPEFLISHSALGVVVNNPVPGLKVKVEEKQIHMSISTAAVADSAVYYCAVKPTVTGNPHSLYKNLTSA
uniref:Immunoglobulin V-set domain-containing protein n=1 Tax=Amphilophus citrinellus TaxID=61819 RepID=A0A3Q0S904_AMPCI